MNRLTATNTNPVTQKVMAIVLSIVPQLEAIGVKYQGLRKWNRTEPRASTINAIAIAMASERSSTTNRSVASWKRPFVTPVTPANQGWDLYAMSADRAELCLSFYAQRHYSRVECPVALGIERQLRTTKARPLDPGRSRFAATPRTPSQPPHWRGSGCAGPTAWAASAAALVAANHAAPAPSRGFRRQTPASHRAGMPSRAPAASPVSSSRTGAAGRV